MTKNLTKGLCIRPICKVDGHKLIEIVTTTKSQKYHLNIIFPVLEATPMVIISQHPSSPGVQVIGHSPMRMREHSDEVLAGGGFTCNINNSRKWHSSRMTL